MGGFDTEKTIIIRDEKNWDPGEQCKVHTIPTAGDKQWVLDQQLLFNQKNKGNRAQRRGGYGGLAQQGDDVELKSQLGAVHRLWVQRMLVSWTIMKKGQIIPLPETEKERSRVLALLNDSYVEFIYDAILKEQPKEEEDDEENEEGDNEDGGTPFIGDAWNFTDGKTGETELAQELMSGSESMEIPRSRNHLMKS